MGDKFLPGKVLLVHNISYIRYIIMQVLVYRGFVRKADHVLGYNIIVVPKRY
jgi:hypothetical protein